MARDKTMTWKDLAEKISKLSEKQKNMDVTVRDSRIEECYPVYPTLETSNSEDFGLDKGHPYIVLKREG